MLITKKYKNRAKGYLKIYLLVGIPILIAMSSCLLAICIGYSNNKETAKNAYGSTVQQLAVNSEEQIKKIIDGADFFTKEDSVTYAMNISNGWDMDSAAREQLSRALSDFVDSYEDVDGMFVLNIDGDCVFDEVSNYSVDNYLKDKLQYVDYSADYWKNLRFMNALPYKILSPTPLKENEITRTVLPIIIRKANNERATNVLVINLKIDSLITDSVGGFLKGGQIYVLNRYTGRLFGDVSGFEDSNILNTELYSKLISGEQTFECNVENVGKSFVVASSTSDSITGYTYFAVISNKWLVKQQLPQLILSIIVCLIFLSLACLMASKGTKLILRPIARVISSPEIWMNGQNNDFLTLAEHKVDNLIKTSGMIESVLPLAQERFLLSFLCSSGYNIDEETKDILQRTFSFRYNYFALVIIQLYPTDTMYDIYNKDEYLNIKYGIYTIVSEMLSEGFDTFVLSENRDSLCIVLNAPNADEKDRIEQIIENFSVYLGNDVGYIEMFAGIGGFYPSFDGMKKAYDEASASIRMVKIGDCAGRCHYQNDVFLTDREERLLFNNLIENRIDETKEMVYTLAKSVSGKSEKTQKQMYVQVLGVVLRAIRLKGIDLNGKMDYEIYTDVITKNTGDVYRKILSLLDMFPKKTERMTAKSEIDRIIEYIENNYQNPDLSRELVADAFNIQGNYLSSLIKKKLGINFKDYLTKLRVERAEELLVRDDGDIQKIYEAVGFVSKQTFYRSFKHIVGVTPGEYRKKCRERK